MYAHLKFFLGQRKSHRAVTDKSIQCFGLPGGCPCCNALCLVFSSFQVTRAHSPPKFRIFSSFIATTTFPPVYTACIIGPLLSFAQPCDEEHLIEERDAEGVTFVSCARSRIRVGRVVADSDSPSGKRCGLNERVRPHKINSRRPWVDTLPSHFVF